MKTILALMISFPLTTVATPPSLIEIRVRQGESFVHYILRDGKKPKLGRITAQREDSTELSKKNFDFSLKKVKSLTGTSSIKECSRNYVGVRVQEGSKDKNWSTCWNSENQSTREIKILMQTLDVLF